MNQKVIYWKPEPQNRKWQLIPDTEEARRLAIDKGAMFFTWISFSEPFKGNGQPEPIRYGDMPLDFDSKQDPAKALRELRDLCLIHLPDFYDLDPYEVEFFCSGAKGFHAVIPVCLFGAEAGDPYLPLIYKKIVSWWCAHFDLTTLDLSLYAMRQGKMFRISNVRRDNGRYKIPLTLEEVRDLTIEQIWSLSEKPRNV